MKKALNLQAGDVIVVDGVTKTVTMIHKNLDGGAVRITFSDFSAVECQWNKAFKVAA